MGTYNQKCNNSVEKDEEIKLCYKSLCRKCINGKTKIKKKYEYKKCINCYERFKYNSPNDIYCEWCLKLNL